ncbi:MAG: bifunctional diaminohydroxyphosphoribosylaminopyrimidine deaminase/5-amino-6-(5-phosphoribosylamino)uracil reductase RibD [Flavobacteriales bacterium]
MTEALYMKRCLELAAKGLGNTKSNPLVGAVIVHNNVIIGEGYHQKYGEAHAEVNAVKAVKDKSLLKTSTIYVSLEPCSHFGKTPPCAELIVSSGIPKVVICNTDPHEKVAGKGIKLLEKNGIEVVQGILEPNGFWLNRRFFTFHTLKRPYIILKWAQNQNGYMDKLRSKEDKGVNWITQPETKTLTHQWRAEEQAILVGASTVLTDSPSLTVRNASGENPLRIVIDPNSRIPSGHEFLNSDIETILVSYDPHSKVKAAGLKLEKGISVATQTLNHLYSKQIISLMVEGGASTLQHFIDENLWDEARVLEGNNDWTEGLASPELKGLLGGKFNYGKDTLKIYKNR